MKRTRRSSTSIVLVVCLLATVVATVIPGAVAAAANRRTPPRVSVIYRGEVVQRARPYTFCWSYGSPDGGATGTCADGFPRYPQAARVDAGSRLKVRIAYRPKPGDWFIRSHRMVVEHEGWHEPVGPSEEVGFRLKPHRVEGVVRAWDLVFKLNEPARHYYIDTGGELKQGDAFYALHLQT